MNRRQLLSGLSAGICGTVAGCGDFVLQPDPPAKLRNRGIEVSSTDSGWTLELSFDVFPLRGSIPDVTIVAYSEQGEVACERTVGQVEGGVADFRLECTAFPALASARTAMNCEEINIDIVYWVGTPEQRRYTPDQLPDDTILWRTTQRQCGESLPPERLLTETEM